ncbi:hypothetical protein BS78_09G077600 [Paspalum vaginatum]|nr:hypothetical protein BS78_09G077600 [Paspalum vaginatum]
MDRAAPVPPRRRRLQLGLGQRGGAPWRQRPQDQERSACACASRGGSGSAGSCAPPRARGPPCLRLTRRASLGVLRLSEAHPPARRAASTVRSRSSAGRRGRRPLTQHRPRPTVPLLELKPPLMTSCIPTAGADAREVEEGRFAQTPPPPQKDMKTPFLFLVSW